MTHNKSHESTTSDPQGKIPSRKRDGNKKLELHTAEDSLEEREESAEGVAPRDVHAADLGIAGEWQVDTKADSAGQPVRREPGLEKKESKKRGKNLKIKDHPEEKKKKPLQPPSSDRYKPSCDKAPEECTTKRNMHLIKTDEDRSSEEDEKNKGKKKRLPIKNQKKDSRGRMGNETPKRKKVELASIHVDKDKPDRPIVERGPIKAENWHDVEREPLYKIIPQYDNLPEDPLMKQLQAPPRDLSYSNPFTPGSKAPFPPPLRSEEQPTEYEKNMVTGQEKKEQSSVGPELTEVSEMQSKTIGLKRAFRNPPWWLWTFIVVIVILLLICITLACAVVVLEKERRKLADEVGELKKKIESLTSGRHVSV